MDVNRFHRTSVKKREGRIEQLHENNVRLDAGLSLLIRLSGRALHSGRRCLFASNKEIRTNVVKDI